MTESAAGGIVPPPSAGAQLRAARERQGVHLGVLASAIKVAPRKLELLESDRIDQLPDASFARALALSMCRALKLDPEPVLAQLPQPAAPGLAEMARGLDQPFRARDARQDDGGSRLPSLPVLGALLLGIGALVVYFLPAGGGGSPAAEAGAPAASAVAIEAPASAVDAAPADAAPVPPSVPAASEAAATVAADPASAAASVPQSVAAVATAAGLSVRARADSWVEVVGAGERVLFSRIVAAGETVTVDAAPPLRVTVGNAGATELLFGGQPVPLKPNRDNIARVELQ